MKTHTLALVLASSLLPVGLAGCQTVEDDGYVYSSPSYRAVYETDYVYRDRPVMRRPPPPPPPRYGPPPPPPPRYGPPPPRGEGPGWRRDDARNVPPPRRLPDGPDGTDGPWYQPRPTR